MATLVHIRQSGCEDFMSAHLKLASHSLPDPTGSRPAIERNNGRPRLTGSSSRMYADFTFESAAYPACIQMAGKNSRVIVRIREMILQGELPPGKRVREVELAAKLGVSRTPVREALPILAQEGVLAQLDTRGFVVRAFTPQEIMDAIDVRGVLEGLAARMLAEQGVPRRLIQSLHECLREGDAIFAKKYLVESDEARYGEMNKLFHQLIVQGSGSKVIADAIERNSRIPFAAAHAIAFDRVNLAAQYDMLNFAHRQHHR